ncbi:hypothetical protein ACFWOT_09120 [Streptomyces sp. NPDC058440]|uniref:hypothetical protein n=1 Tax=Streptomyces sp. NPDC058440 TaxID=3346501 RepID=UPI003649422A
MARRVVETITCDACAKKGAEVAGTVTLVIMGDKYDLCDEHGNRFRAMLADALGNTGDTALSA